MKYAFIHSERQHSYDAVSQTLIVRELEVDHKILVTTLRMDILSCKTPDMVEKEIWIYLLAHNPLFE